MPMVRPIVLLALAAPGLLAACATVPAREVALSGALPAPGGYRLVQSDTAAAAPLAVCLGNAGYAERQPAALLVQVAHAVRPARAQVLRGTDEPARGPRVGARRDQEDLTVAFTDPASGALLWRGAVKQRLRKGETPGDGTALVEPLCAAIRDGRAAAAR